MKGAALGAKIELKESMGGGAKVASFCKFVATCPIYEGMSQREKNLLGAKFCLGDYEECARYKLAKEKGKEAVPLDLMPDGTRKGGSPS